MKGKRRQVGVARLGPRAIWGVDFSAARDAGTRIWVARGRYHGACLEIHALDRIADLPNGARDRDAALAALRELLGRATDAVVGIDAPLGLPLPLLAAARERGLLERLTWRQQLGLVTACQDADAFRASCVAWAAGRELRRETDRIARTPFSPYNLRMYRQTFALLAEIVAPLVKRRRACVLPMQAPRSGAAWLMEACPASLLKRLRAYAPYKGRAEEAKRRRAALVDALAPHGALAGACALSFDSRALRTCAVENADGDALDAALCALSVARSLRDTSTGHALPLPGDGASLCEGYVYVGA